MSGPDSLTEPLPCQARHGAAQPFAWPAPTAGLYGRNHNLRPSPPPFGSGPVAADTGHRRSVIRSGAPRAR